MAHTVSEVSELVKKCNQLSKENLELRQAQEHHAIEIQKRDTEISELKGMIQLVQRGATSIVDSESRLALERDTLLAANQNQSLELKDKVAKIRQLEDELKETRHNGNEVKDQLTSLRSEVTVANERIQQLETENAQLKAGLNVARQNSVSLTSYAEQAEENEATSYTDTEGRDRSETRGQVAEHGTWARKRVESNDVLYVIAERRGYEILYDPEMKIAHIPLLLQIMCKERLDIVFLEYVDSRNEKEIIWPIDTRTLAQAGIIPNTKLFCGYIFPVEEAGGHRATRVPVETHLAMAAKYMLRKLNKII